MRLLLVSSTKLDALMTLKSHQLPMPSAQPKFFWPAKIKFWLAKNNLAGQKHQNPIQK